MNRGRDQAIAGPEGPGGEGRLPGEMEAFYHFLTEHSRDLFLRLSPEGRAWYVSPTIRRVLGYAPEEVAGTRFLDLAHAEDTPTAAEVEARLHEGDGPCAATARFRRKDGSYVWLELLMKPVHDHGTGALREVLVTARDVTDRKLSESVMSESERRFRAAFEQAAVGMSHNALDGRWLRVNARLCEMMGYSEHEMLVRDFQSLTHPLDLPRDLEQRERLLRGEIPIYKTEKRYLRKDGRILWVNLTLSVVRHENGDPDYLLAVLEDITQRKRSEQDLAVARRDLSQMERLSALGTLVGGVAHEVRTPLTYAVNHLQFLRLRLARARDQSLTEADIKQFQQGVTDALEGLDRINQLVQDLRRFAQHGTGEHAPRDLNEVLQEALTLFHATHRGTHQVVTRLAPLPLIPLDRVQAQQVVLNLLDNAADAMPLGGQIEVVTRVDGPEVELAVKDRGTGIPPDVQARIFDPLYTTKSKGMGLGLSIVRRIVEAHGGRIGFETAAGVGTTFLVHFPKAPPGSAAGPEAPAAGSSVPGPAPRPGPR
ncbi:MAG TPA: PAS domain S-box protein [Candidatus Thermoplasmatota archaeon]|nr:PAS domain S-box protein [Candidatus Thermoplasmatota archaeon]